MSTHEAQRYLKAQSRKFLFMKMTEAKLLALGIGLLAFALTRLMLPILIVSIAVGVIAFAAVLVLRVSRTGALKWDAMRVALFLNGKFPELKDSADLLVSEKPSSSLEEVQRLRVLQSLESVKPRVTIPHRIGQGLLILATGIVAVFLLPAAVQRPALMMPAIVVDSIATRFAEPVLGTIEIRSTPPAYTGIQSSVISGGNFKVPAGSRITWYVTFDGQPVSPAILMSSGDSLVLSQSQQPSNPATRPPGDPATRPSALTASSRANQPSFYQVTWRDAKGKRYASDFFYADVREDAPPVVEVTGREQFQVVKPGESLQFDVNVTASDDYGVRDAHLIATVTKGSGESVKFREVTLTFENAHFPRKQSKLTRHIDLGQLGLEPGDELYFYAEALDNKSPVPNLSRTETFFIALQDTAEAVTVADSGLGVDLMPDYFRSQRQLIIDTEKLIAEQRKIKKQEFNFRSNELGFDQKALRLKYGQFLGMEDEMGIGVVATVEEEHEEDEEEDPAKKFGHAHDKENEHNLVDEKKTGAKTETHAHADEEEESLDPLKAFLHNHDSEEEATFHNQSVKTKLKAALTLMWDSELHLRMYEPKKSLPYQYKILKLLKEIAQDNRAYVHRTGLDAPPIKEEKRLTGDLDEVSGTTEHVITVKEKKFPGIQSALGYLETALQQGQPALTAEGRAAMQQAGYEVAAEAIEQPGKYFQTLSSLRRLADGSVDPTKFEATLLAVRRDFWLILPQETYDPARVKRTLHSLDQSVLKEMEKMRE